MTPKTYMLGMCLALASVCSFATEQTFAQAVRTATKSPQPESLPSTGSAASNELRGEANTQSAVSTKSFSDAASSEATQQRKRSTTNADIKAWRVEFTNWLNATPGAKETLDATEQDLYHRNAWKELYNYREAKRTKTN